MATAENKLTPGKPETEEIRGTYWKLLFRNGKRANEYEFSTIESITLTEAIAKGRRYCQLRRLDFLNVSSLFDDIDKANEYYESKKENGDEASLTNRKPGIAY